MHQRDVRAALPQPNALLAGLAQQHLHLDRISTGSVGVQQVEKKLKG